MTASEMTKSLMRVSIGYLLIVLCSSVASAANSSFYINAEKGNDNADGRSEANAWRTFRPANNRIFAPGDKLLLKAGCRWSGQLKLQGSGTKDNVIRVSRYGAGRRPLIAGDGKADAAVILKNGSYWVLEDLEITNTIREGKRRNGMRGVQVVANEGGVFRQIVLQGLHVHHVSGGWDRHGGSGILITSSGTRGDGSARKSRYDGLSIENCYVHDVSFYGILVSGWENRLRGEKWFPSSGVVIRNNFTHDTGGDSIVVIACEKPLIEHNEAHRCAIGQFNGGKTHAAGMWPHSSDGTVMRYNKVLDIKAEKDGQAYDVDINCHNTLIEYNWSQRNASGFLLLCSPDQSVPGTSGVIVQNNVSIDDGVAKNKGIFMFVSDVRDVTIQNNAFLSSGRGKQNFMATWRPGKNKGWKTDVLFKDNIFSTLGTFVYKPASFVVPTFKDNTYAGQFQNLPKSAVDIHVKYPAVRIDNGKVVPTHNGSTFKPFDISKAGLLPTSSWMKQRDLSASGEVRKQDGEPRHACDAK